jgi:hypothetical protein
VAFVLVLVGAGALVAFILTGGLRPVATSLVASFGAFGFLALGVARTSRPPEGDDHR